MGDATRTDATLRARAEAILRERKLPPRINPSADIEEMLYDLQLHQVELELQRDELLASNKALAGERERFRDLYDYAPVGYLSLTADGTIADANFAASDILGRERDAVIGRRLGVFAIEDDRSRLQSFLDQHFAEGFSDHCELRFGNDIDPARIVQIDSALRPDRSYSRVTLTDITWRRRAEDEMRRLEQTLHDAQKMEAIGRLAGGIAHDFNNLLTIINNYSELLDADLPPDDPRHEVVREISRAGDRAAALTSQLLTFSRKQVLAVRVTDVNDIARAVTRMFSRVIGENITLTTNISARPVPVEVDAGQLERVLINLIVNARDAMPSGGTIMLSTKMIHLANPLYDVGADLPPGDYARITVRDTGEGMAPAIAARVFEPFFTTKDVGRGTGLGLSIAYGIISQCHGHISVQSQPGKGSSFSILLPACLPQTSLLADAPDGLVHIGGSETILLVEDEASVRALTQRMLTSLGYTVLPVSGGDLAVRAVAEHGDRINLLLTDIVMPSMSGSELVTRVRQRLPDIKVLYMSGYSLESVRRRGVEIADSVLLQKPFTSEGLAKAVRQTLDRSPDALELRH